MDKQKTMNGTYAADDRKLMPRSLLYSRVKEEKRFSWPTPRRLDEVVKVARRKQPRIQKWLKMQQQLKT